MPAFRVLIVLGVLCLLSAPRAAECGMITEYAVSDRGGADAPRNGVFDSLTPETDVAITVSNPLSGFPAERRAAFEYSLGALPGGATVTSAKFMLRVVGTAGVDPLTIRVYGYSGNGAVSLADMLQTSTPLSGPLSASFLTPVHIVDVTTFLQNLTGSSATHAGFLVAADIHFNDNLNLVQIGSSNQSNPLARTRLEINYEEAVSPVPEPSSLVLLATGSLIGAVRYRRRRTAARS